MEREFRYPQPVLSFRHNSVGSSGQKLSFVIEKGETEISVLQQVQGSCPELCQGGGTACGLG